MNRDANQIAAEHARREQREQGEPRWDHQSLQPPRPEPVKPRRGTLSIWDQLSDMLNGMNPLTQFENVTVNVNENLIITTDTRGARAIYYPRSGMYFEFVPDAEG